MSAIAPNPPAVPVRIALPVLPYRVTEELKTEWWIAPIKWTALAVFIALPLFCLLFPWLAGRVVWTVVVAALPLFIVLVGYHRWRKICPLAFFAQLPSFLRFPGRHRASARLERVYYYVAFGVFFLSLWLRLIATNGDGAAVALFFVALSLIAFAVGARYTGKTWCNYFCPLSFIEKIYTEPHGLRETPNSQCPKCTACKKSCPDISEENGYWTEIGSRPKQFVYFAFPGLVFGFYFYYYLQSGAWDYYFGGSWTNQPKLWLTAFVPGIDARTAGFFFLPQIPRALAAALTLGLCALVSVAFFSTLELAINKRLSQHDAKTDAARARHVVLSVSAFTAFVTFYTFAGAPTLRRLPWGFPHLFLILVVLTATLFLARRLQRRQTDFAEEILARNIIKRWQWEDIQPPRNLREALLTHQIRARERARDAGQIVDIYREAVQEAVADGFVTREEVQMLSTLRSQLEVSDADHEKVMLTLAEEESAMLRDPLKHLTAEKRLQLETYARTLGDYVKYTLSNEDNPDQNFIRRLSFEFRVTKEEHEAVLRRLMGDAEGIVARLAIEVGRVESAARAIQVLERAVSPTHELLGDLLYRLRARAIERLLRGLRYTSVEEPLVQRVRESLASNDENLVVPAWEELRAHIAQITEGAIVAPVEIPGLPTLFELLHECLNSADAYVRAVALFALYKQEAATVDILESKSQDENQLVRDTARGLLSRSASAGTVATSSLLIVEKMIALRGASVFRELGAESLAALAYASTEDFLPAGTALCTEGEAGNEVFILLGGDVSLFKHDGAEERFVGNESAGDLIGEMAVLDPAPRSATVIAGDSGVRVLRLDGSAFRQALGQHSSIAVGVIRTLTRRLRGAQD